jgi:dethiobiotin synthetase
MIKGIFITGTDTGVGKTFVSAGIARALRARGIGVGVMKPAETGCRSRDGKLLPADAMTLMRSAEVSDPLDLINPYRFRAPLAPMVAAQQEGRTIDLRKIKEAFRHLAKKHEFLIVEGAGGIMVPLTSRTSYLDLVAELRLPVLIIARPGLGTINHTLLTIMALAARRVPIAGTVFNHSTERRQGPAERTNPTVIEYLSGMPVLGQVHYGQEDFDVLADRLVKMRKQQV